MHVNTYDTIAKDMAESGVGFHNSDNLLRPIEQGMVEKFDKLFSAREKTLKRWIADQVTNKQEFLTRTFPTIIQAGAEHPQLAGGALYMMGLLTEHTHAGSEAINSIPRRFAERLHTKGEAKVLRPLLKNIHIAQEETHGNKPIEPKLQQPISTTIKPEQANIINLEIERARITRELYDFQQCPVDVRYEKNGTLMNLGTNSSEISILNKESKTGKTTVFLCSSAGNPPGVESYAVEYALRTGNRVFVIGQPDGASGHMSQAFADAAVADAQPPLFDPLRKFQTPSYEPHTQFMKQAIKKLLPNGETFDLYSHSGGGLMAKNLLHDPEISDRVHNAIFLNPAGTTTMHTLFPVFFRRFTLFRSLAQAIGDLPHIFRSTYDNDRNEGKHTGNFWFRDRVSVAIQSGSHYRQPDWDTMKVRDGKIVLYVGGKDIAVGGKQFAKFINNRLLDSTNPTPSPVVLEYDKNGHHLKPFSHPEEVFNRVSGRLATTEQAST
jgi:hypothetical protein